MQPFSQFVGRVPPLANMRSWREAPLGESHFCYARVLQCLSQQALGVEEFRID